MADLSANRRKNIPKSEMGLPGEATKKGGAVAGSYPMPDKNHARLAKAMASKEVNAGNLSKAAESKIDAKADKILGGGAADHARAMHEKAKAQAQPIHDRMNKKY